MGNTYSNRLNNERKNLPNRFHMSPELYSTNTTYFTVSIYIKSGLYKGLLLDIQFIIKDVNPKPMINELFLLQQIIHRDIKSNNSVGENKCSYFTECGIKDIWGENTGPILALEKSYDKYRIGHMHLDEAVTNIENMFIVERTKSEIAQIRGWNCCTCENRVYLSFKDGIKDGIELTDDQLCDLILKNTKDHIFKRKIMLYYIEKHIISFNKDDDIFKCILSFL